MAGRKGPLISNRDTLRLVNGSTSKPIWPAASDALPVQRTLWSMATRICPSCSASISTARVAPFSSGPPAVAVSFPDASTVTIRHALAESSSP